VDSAIWYMEAASNQTYGDASTPFVDYAIDSCKITIPASNGTIQYNDLLIAYDQMIDSLSAKYNLIPYENKHLVMNDVVLESEETGTVTLGVIAGFGAEGEAPASFFNDPWWYGFLQGKCDNTCTGSDAAEEIEDKIHARKGTLPPNSYYLDIDSVYVEGCDFVNPNDPFRWDNMYDYLMFFNIEDGITPNVHSCVSIDEMSFYLFGTEDVIYTYEPDGARPQGKSFISVNLWGDMTVNTATYRMHRAWVSYGVLHLNSEPPSGL
nr:hypothetical protein [Bacteroidota bacterium]